MRLSALFLIPICTCHLLASGSKPFAFTAEQFVKRYNAKSSENMKGTLQIKQFGPQDGLRQSAQFDQDRNLFLDAELEFTGSRNRRITKLEVYTKNRGGQMWGDVDLHWAVYTIMRIIHNHQPLAKIQTEVGKLELTGAKDKSPNSQREVLFDGFRYIRVGNASIRRSSITIEKM